MALLYQPLGADPVAGLGVSRRADIRQNTAPVRLGVLGAGPWGRNVIKTIRRLDGVELTGVISGNPETAACLGPETILYPDLDAALAGGRFEGLFICSPPAAHAEAAEAAMKRGLAVMVEKPLCLSGEEAKTLETAAETFEGRIGVDHIHLFAPEWQHLKAEIRPETMIRIMARAGGERATRPDASLLWDWAPHDLAMVFDLLEAPITEARCRLLDRTARGETLSVEGLVANRPVSLTFGTDWPDRERLFEIETTAGTWRYRDHVADKLTLLRDDVETPVSVETAWPLDGAVQELARLSRLNSPDTKGLVLGRKVVEAIEQLEQGRG
ncbi:MAG: Gfo/Idh/MocA family protein [Magnetovibrionaceae bacterium]